MEQKIERIPLRACLVSFKKQRNKSEYNHLQTRMEQAFTVFPKSVAFLQPGKTSLNDPTFWYYHKAVKFVTFYNLHLCANQIHYRIGKRLSNITAITQNRFNT